MPTPDLQTPRATVLEMLERTVTAFPDRPALRRAGPGGPGLTYAALAAESDDLAMSLVDLRVGPEERVGIIGGNSPRWALAYLAIHKAGGIAVPMDAALKEREITDIGRAADLRFVFADAPTVPAVRAALPRAQVLGLDDEAPGATAYGPLLALGHAYRTRPQLRERRPRPERLAALIFTSGTTGSPKAVALSHRNIAANVASVLEMFPIGPGDAMLSVLPLHHTFECTMGLLMPLSVGARVEYARGLKSRELVEDLASSGATIMLGVPLLYEKMIAGVERALAGAPGPGPRAMHLTYRALRRTRAPLGMARALMAPVRRKAGLGPLRFFVSGAAALREDTFHGFRALGIEMLQGYGLTETSPVLTVNPPGKVRPGSVGPPIAGVELVIDSPGPDGIGEVWARGENVMLGYYADPGRTAAVMHEGWFRTGDLGRIDEAGYLYLSGRQKNMIATSGGKKIYPEEVEAVLTASPLIADALVYGRRQGRSPHEEVCAVLYPEWPAVEAALGGPDAAGEAAVQALLKAEVSRLSGQLAEFKRVRDFTVRREDFPRTHTGKLKRFLFRNGEELPEPPAASPRGGR